MQKLMTSAGVEIVGQQSLDQVNFKIEKAFVCSCGNETGKKHVNKRMTCHHSGNYWSKEL